MHSRTRFGVVVPSVIEQICCYLRIRIKARTAYSCRWFTALLCAPLIVLGSISVARAGYAFTSMVPAGFYTSGAGNGPAINNLGQVASYGYANNSDEQIGLSNGTQTVGLLNPLAIGDSLGAGMWLNDAGQVTARSDGTILIATTSSVGTLPNTTGWALDDDNFAAANIPNSPVAWTGYQGDAWGLFLTSFSGTTRTLATSTASDFFFPYVNASGTVCYDTQTGTQTAIYATNGTTTRTVATSSSADVSVIDKGIDNNGDVLWQENLTNGNEDLWLTSPGGTNSLVANTTGAYAQFSDPYAFSAGLSPSGQIAFIATLKNGNVGIFTGPDPVADKVIEEGDPLFGGTVGFVLSIGPECINDNGSLAFVANTESQGQFQDYVVRADPVPEPATLAVAISGFLLMLRQRRESRETSE